MTLPVISATAPATGSYVKDTKVSYTLSEAGLSGSITWTQTGGTADGASPHIQALTGAELNSGAHAGITLTNNTTLVDGAIYSIAYNVTDLAGNAAVAVTNTNITYDVTLPVISATTPATGSFVKDTKVSYTLSEPALSGTITWTRTGGTADGAVHTQALAGAELNSGAHANITLANAPTLVDGAIYSIAYDVTDLAGNAAVTVTNTSITYDVSAPVVSATAPATGSYVKDTKVSYTISEPALSGTITWTQTGGTADPASPQVMSLVGAELNSGAHANITLTNAPALVDGAIYSISYDVIDLSGNASVTVTNTNVTYDVTLPVISATTPATGSFVKDTKVSYTLSEPALSGTITWTQTGGTADPASPQVMALTGAELNSGAHASITLTNAPTLVDGAVYSIAYNVNDLAGNAAVAITNTSITYDVTAPVITGTTPATGSYVKDTKVSYTLSEPALSGTITWTQTGGTADPASPQVMSLTGAELNSGAHAFITLTNAPTLVDGAIYSLAYNVTDLSGNASVTVTNTSVTYDVTLPVISATAPATGSYVKDTKVSYTLSEPALSGTITWTRTGGTADGAIHTQTLAGAELNSGAHANITLSDAPTLVDGAIYSIAYDVTDLAGNASATVTNTNVTYDVTLPVISATTPATGSYIKDTKVSYTLSEAALSGTITWTQTGGTADPASPQVMALAGAELNSGAHANITLTNAPTLVDGAIYSIAYNVTDLAGNAAVTITNTNILYDVTLPVISATVPATGSYVKDTKVSYTLSEAALSGSITWTQTGGTADPASPQVMSLAGAELNSGAHASIILTNAPTLVDGAIYSIAYSVTDLAGNTGITVTNTNITYDVTLPVISATTPATGSYVKDTKVSYTLSEPALSGTISWTRTGGSVDGTIHTQALAGAELNSGAHANITLTNAPTLVDGAVYSIAYDVIDLAGNAAITVTNTSITYDVSAPVVSATTPVTGSYVKDTKVSYTISEPALSGTITWTRTGGTADGAIHTQALTGAELNSGAHANIVLANAPTLVDGAIYSIAYDVVDLSGNASVTVTNTNVTYDVTLPVISATAPTTGSFVKDTKVSYTLSEPALSGTITWTRTGGTADGAVHTQTLAGAELNSGAHANITLANAPTLVDGAVYSIAYDVTDLAGNVAITITNTSITYDVSAPVVSATTPVTGSYVKDTKVSYTISEPALSGTITWTRTGGTADGAIHTQALTGAELNSGAHANIVLANAPTLVDGAIYSIAYDVVDLSGNASVTVTNTSITYDVTSPVISATTPTTGSFVKDAKVSYTLSEPALSGTITWTRTGGTADGAIHTQALAGAELNSGAHASITLTNAPTLVDGAIYSIAYDVTDLAGNASATVTNTNITYDVTLPVISATTPATGSYVKDTKVSYTLSEAALSGTITWTQTGGTADPASPQVMALSGAELNSGAHANITLTNAPTLVDGAIYSIAYNVTDLAGNAAVTIINTNILYDVTLPVISATAPATGSYVKDTKVSYTLSEAGLSGSITWTQTGGTADGASPHIQALTGAELNSGAHAGITLTNNPTLVDGAIYSIAYNVTDLAGNAAVAVTNTNITYDVTLPVISATTPATGSFVKDTKVSYTLSEPALSGTVTWTRTGGTADGTVHTQALAGAELNSGAHANIVLANAPTLVDGAVYSISYDVTDLAGNLAITVTNTSITYDVSAPVVSATTPVTGSYVKDTKVSYTISEPALSGTITWTRTGGSADGAVHAQVLTGAELNSGAHANITLTNAPTLVDGAIYSISYDVIDLSGNASVTVTNTNITYDVTLPVISATTPATGSYVKDTKVSYTLSEPALSGTITWTRTGGTADGAVHTQALAGAELNSGAHANIILASAPTLVDGAVYSIAYDVTDLAGNVAITITNTSITYDVTAPVITGTAPATGSFVKDTKVSYTLSEPALSGTITWTQTGGTADPASPQVMALAGAELNSGAHASITLTNAPTLVDGAVYSIAYSVTDLAGNTSVTVTNTSVTYDVTLPVVSATTPATGSYVKDTKVSYTLSEPALSGTITWTRTGGTADGAIHTQALAGAELNSGAHAAITLTNAPTLVDGAIYSIAYDVTDLAGNASVTVTNTNVTYDVTLPVISATAPATGSFVKDMKVSYTLSEPALSGTITWTQTSGTADPSSPQVMSLTGAELNLGAHANITITNAPTLVDGAIYSISYDVTDLAGNTAVTVTNTNVTYDVSVPVITATAPATGSYVKDAKVSYTLSEAALSGSITWTQTGGTADPASPQVMSLTGAELNSGAHASFTLTNAPTLVDGAIYSIAYNVTDLAGNAAVTVINTNITYDVTLPVISATTPATGSFVKDTKVSYTLSEPALSGTITWTRTGGSADGTIHTQALAGAELNSGAHANITLTNAPTLVDGAVYSIAYDVTDLAGNAAVTVTNTSITYDVSAPVVSATAPATGSYVKDTKVSYTISEPALSGTITWTQTGGTADPASPQVMSLVGAELNSGAHANITLTNAPALVDGAIYSISYDVIDLSGNASVTVTNTNVTYDVTLPVISATTPATGSFVKDTKVSYTLSEPALSGTITWTQTGGTADPASPQVMALTGAELNSGAHASITLTNAPTLVDGAVYSIAYNVNDLAGNAAVAITNTSITYDVTAPVITGTTPATGSYVKDTKVSYTLSEPALSGTITWTQTGGTADPASPQVMSLTGAELNSGAHAFITLTNAPTLVDGAIYSLAYNVTDLSGNASVTVTNTSVTYDVTLPVISATAPATGSYVKDTKVSYTLSEPALSGTITWTRTGGTADGAIHTQTLAGAELNSGAHANITLSDAPTLVDGTIYSIAYDVTDLAGNASATVTNTNVTYDVTLPVISATTPATGSYIKDTKVSYTLSEAALSGTITWTQTGGTADPASPQVMALAGAELNSGAHANITLTNAPTLVDGAIYSIAYNVTDLAGNAAVTITNTNILYDVTLPVISATVPATGSYVKETKVSYTLSEAALSGSITWTQTGGTADPASPQVMSLAGAELNSGAHASIILTNAPTLVDGAIYSIAYSVTDLAGNTGITVTNTNITYDVTLPVISATTPATGSYVKDTKVSYTLSEPALSGTVTWTRTGGTADGTIHTQALAGAELNSGAHANITLANAPTLVDGAVYSISYDVTDLAGNAAVTITNTSITYDVSAPVVSATTPVTGSYVKDTKVSYTISEPALSGTITWTRTGGSADGAVHAQALTGAELNSGAHANITLTNAPTLVDGAIYSIAYDVIDLSGNASVTVTNTNVTYDVTLPVISATAPTTGSFVKDTKVSYTLSEPALSGTITWTLTGGTADGTVHSQALAGAELNSGAHANITLANAPTLVDGAVYSIAYNVNDLAGNAAVAITNTSITYDVTLPVISATTPATGSFVKDTKVSYTLSEPALSGTVTWMQTGGTVDPASPQVMSLTGAELNSGAHASITLTNAPTLVDGAIYSIAYNVTDLAGNASVTVTNTNVTYDVTLPVISATAPATSSYVKDTKVSYTLSEPALSGTITWTRTGGTADGAIHTQALAGAELNSGAHAAIILTNAPTLVDGAIYSIAYDVTDLAGNTSVTVTNTNVTYDVTLPVISATTPATGSFVKDTKVSYTLSEPALSGTITWTQTSGTADPASPQVMSLAGAELNSGAHAAIILINAPTLVDGAIYSISYDVTDLAGNASCHSD